MKHFTFDIPLSTNDYIKRKELIDRISLLGIIIFRQKKTNNHYYHFKSLISLHKKYKKELRELERKIEIQQNSLNQFGFYN